MEGLEATLKEEQDKQRKYGDLENDASAVLLTRAAEVRLTRKIKPHLRYLLPAYP